MQRWEYRFARGRPSSDVRERDLQASKAWEQLLNELGEEGWELVSQYRDSGGHPAAGQPYWTQFAGTLKRRLPAPEAPAEG
jgi:hypothetical protein